MKFSLKKIINLAFLGVTVIFAGCAFAPATVTPNNTNLNVSSVKLNNVTVKVTSIDKNESEGVTTGYLSVINALWDANGYTTVDNNVSSSTTTINDNIGSFVFENYTINIASKDGSNLSTGYVVFDYKYSVKSIYSPGAEAWISLFVIELFAWAGYNMFFGKDEKKAK